MQVDTIIKNANVYTSNLDALKATAFAVKDGKFVYVGDEAGLKDYEGEIRDLNGKFVMPGIIDSHIHIPVSLSSDYAPEQNFIMCKGKAECLKIISDVVKNSPGQERYSFRLAIDSLNGDKLTRDDLDAITSDSEIMIIEAESHSGWLNSKAMENEGITEETPDIAPGLSYYERDENGRKTGYLVEMTIIHMMMSPTKNITDEQIRESVLKCIENAKNQGVCAYFEAGTPGAPEFHERVYKVMRDMDRKGELPVYIEGSYSICDRESIKTAVETMKHYREEFSTGNLRVNTLKIMMDGTVTIHTAALVTPYADTGTVGGCLMNKYEVAELLKELNENGFDLHVHTVGEMAVRTVLDGVEIVKNELGDAFKSKVTCAHIELMDDADLDRFAKLGVNANYTPWWHAGGGAGGGGTFEDNVILFGEERAWKYSRSRSVWDTGANVCWSCDNVMFGDFRTWSPYLGMEGGITRIFDEKSNLPEEEKLYVLYESASERMTHDQMLIGYTINNAKQLRIEDRKGSIEVGKDADYIIFDEDLQHVDPRGMSHILPKEVFYGGVKVK